MRLVYCAAAVFLHLALTLVVAAQEDLSRRNELPSRIGGPACTNTLSGGTAMLQGSLNVQGVSASEKAPTFTISVFASGILVTRQKIKNGGSFNFTCIPNDSVTLTAEVDSIEMANYSLGQLLAPPSMNRQDIFINWSEAGTRLRNRGAVISARNAYERTEPNQKIFDRAMAEAERKKGDLAVKLLGELVERDPNDYVALYELGTLHFMRERFDLATNVFEKAISVKPDHVPSILGLGRTYLSANRPDDAITFLEKGTSANPASPDLHHYLGEAYLRVKKGSLAITHWNKAIELDPFGKADIHLRIAALYHVAGAKHLAANEYRLLLEKMPNHPDREKLKEYIAQNSAGGN